MIVAKSQEHLAAESVVQTAIERLDAARAAHAARVSAVAQLQGERNRLMTAASAGDFSDTEILDAETGSAATEALARYAAAALEGAESALADALAAVRPHLQSWYERRHREILARRAEKIQRADAILRAARAALAETDDERRECLELRREAEREIPDSARLPMTFLPPPISTAGVHVKVTRYSGLAEREFASFGRALGV
jgi:hypothetical protein